MTFVIALFLFLRPVFPLAEYVFNYTYIVTELCENRDKPQLACNGKCHLMKELAKSAQEENPAPEKKAASAYPEFFAVMQAPVLISFEKPELPFSNPSDSYSNFYSGNFSPVFLRPPSIG